MAQEFYMETPYYNAAAMVPMAQKFYKKTSNYSTTVVPLTQEWMSRLQTNMDNIYGSTWIIEKFLTSLSECERETPPTYQDASVQEFASQCNSGVGNNQKSWTSQPIARNRFGETVSEDANNRTTSEVTQPQAAPPSKTGKNCSNGTIKASVCLSPFNKFAGDGSELKRLEEAELLHSPDIEGWVFWSRSEAGSIYYSEDEMPEEMTGHSIGPDVDRMEEKLVFPTPSVPDRLVNSEGWVFWSRSEAGSIYYSEDEMSEEMTGHSIIGPDVDRMEEKLVFPTPVCQIDWSTVKIGSSGQEDEMSEEMTGHSIGPDVDRMEERPVFLTSSVPDRLVNKSSDYPSEEIYLLDHIEVDHQSDGTEDLEEIQLLDFIKQLQLDHSSDGTEENFQLLDPFEMPGVCVWQNSLPEHEVVTTNRLSRYDLHHGPTHRVRSPSCPLIGARGDSRERSAYRDNTVVAVQHHQVNGIVARTTKGKTVKPVANKTSYYSSHTTPMGYP
ncbi:hypothetical protein Bbelb_268380 [Branchiostoma belcheri]|nr:hypothetical protein Bbelb_268380 [Branchiostoma belcheri]